MPSSRVGEYRFEDDAVDSAPYGSYCIEPPAAGGDLACSRLYHWPPYPGRVRSGEQGDRVKAWQSVLIATGVISERPENHEGIYGPATRQAVKRYLTSRHWSNPDEGAVLGPRLYSLLTGVPGP